ncbi:hypothetical protein ACFL29_02180 [Patescibacteria group bacterium]
MVAGNYLPPELAGFLLSVLEHLGFFAFIALLDTALYMFKEYLNKLLEKGGER